MKARRNRIRLQKRRPRIRLQGNPAPAAAWVRDRFIDGPTLSGAITWIELDTGPRRPGFWERLGERLRILGWIFRLLRR